MYTLHSTSWQQDCKLSREGFCIWWAHVLLSFTQGSIGKSEGSHIFIKYKKCGLHQTCKTVEWPHRLLRNPRDEPLRSRLNDVLGAFMIAFLWNCFWLQQPSCLTAVWWQHKWNFPVTAWTPWSSVSFADVDCQAQLSTIILCYTVFATWACSSYLFNF